MDKYGNKYFENLEEELPRQWTAPTSPGQAIDAVISEDALGGLQGEGI